VSLFRFIAAEKANHSISLISRLLGVSRSGLHASQRRPPSDWDLVLPRLLLCLDAPSLPVAEEEVRGP